MSYPPPPGAGDSENPEQPPYGSTPPPPPPPYGAPPPPPPYGSAPPPPPYGNQPPQYGAPGYGAPGYGAPYGNPYGPPTQSSQKALWSLILGIAGIACCGLAAVAALIMGNQAKKEIAASGGTQTGEGQAQAGYILGIIGCVLWVLGIIAYIILFAVAGADSFSSY